MARREKHDNASENEAATRLIDTDEQAVNENDAQGTMLQDAPTRMLDTDPADAASEDATELTGSSVPQDEDEPATRPERNDAPPPSSGVSTHSVPNRSSTTLEVGDVLRSRFEITAVLGAGGMGTVYRATDLLKREARDENTDVALKVLNTALGDARLSFMALQRETRRAQQLAHPNIVTVYDFDRADGVIYMTMEFMQGQPLDSLLEKHPEGLKPELARRIARDIIGGLSYAHQSGIVHADLKPENVFVLDDGPAKILDFGIARAYRAERRDIVEEAVRGFTPRYATPDLMAGKKPTPADDIYALGCVLYQVFTGEHPYARASGAEAFKAGMKAKRASVFKRSEWNCLAHALDFDATRRPADARQFKKQFLPSPGRRSAVITAIVAVLGAVTYTVLYDPEAGPDIAFEDLPTATQAKVTRDLTDAQAFGQQGDLNSALQLFDAALRTHPGNRDAVEGMNTTAEAAIERVLQAHQDGRLDTDSARMAIGALLEYESLPSQSRKKAQDAIESLN